MKVQSSTQRANIYEWFFIVVTFLIAVAYNACGRPVKFEFGLTEEAKRDLLSQGGILINDGDRYTKYNEVKLSLFARDAREMYITEDSSCQFGGEWENFRQRRSWKLNQFNHAVSVYVRYRDFDGVVSECLQDEIIHDDLPPRFSSLNGPPTVTSSAGASFQLQATDNLSKMDGLSFLCVKPGQDQASFEECGANFSLSQLTEGEQTVVVKVRDQAGNESEVENYQWIVDMSPPKVNFVRRPPLKDGSNKALFEVSAVDDLSAVETIECQRDGQQYQACAASFEVSNLTEGRHKIYVRAVDKAGNISTPVSYDWQVDLTRPTVMITSAIDYYNNNKDVVIQFSGSDKNGVVKEFECQIDGSFYQKCSSPLKITKLNEKRHLFYVRSVDSVGHRSDPASLEWITDFTAPTVADVQWPMKYSKLRKGAISFALADGMGSGIEKVKCSINGQEIPCLNVLSYELSQQGPVQAQIVAVDRAGNSSMPQSYSWVADWTAPTLEFMARPDSFVASTQAEWAWKVADNLDGDVTIECRIDEGLFEPCSNPHRVENLAEGARRFESRARDLAGNVSAPLAHDWYIDLQAPTVTLVQYPEKQALGEVAVFQVMIEDYGSGVQFVECGVDGQLAPCPSELISFADLAEGEHVFTVRTADNVGNEGLEQYQWQVTDFTLRVDQSFDSQQFLPKADILIVADNSGSMNYEQKRMAERIYSFTDQLYGIDWQIAVTTTDPSDGHEYGDGKFRSFPHGSFILRSSEVVAEDAKRLLSETVKVRTNGSGSEQGIRAVYRAIERAFEVPTDGSIPAQQDFFRSNSALAVIVLSDEDESRSNFKNRPQELINLIQTKWSLDKPFAFHSVITIPGDQACYDGHGAKYGYVYEKLSQTTGGVVASVCEEDYGTLLADVGEQVRKLVKALALRCEPLDRNEDGEPDFAWSDSLGTIPAYEVRGANLIFSDSVPEGNHTVSYWCNQP